MDTVWKFLTSHEVWIGLTVGVVATWAAGSLPKVVKATFLWVPRKAGREVLDFIKEAPNIQTMRADPRTAAPYVGLNLARLMTNLAAILFCAGVIGVYQITDPGWYSKWHFWVVLVTAILIISNFFRSLKHFAFIWFAYRTFFDPPKALDNLKVGEIASDATPKETAIADHSQSSQQAP